MGERRSSGEHGRIIGELMARDGWLWKKITEKKKMEWANKGKARPPIYHPPIVQVYGDEEEDEIDDENDHKNAKGFVWIQGIARAVHDRKQKPWECKQIKMYTQKEKTMHS